MNDVNVNQLWSRALVEELARGGVREAVICPGSRSSPLALALASEPSVRSWSVVDERSAAFFALGMAKQSGRPVAVLATSGSAGAHFLPAAIEASQAGVPLVLLTADRPLELQGWGAPQTIPQHSLFGVFSRFFADLGTPEASDTAVRHLRATAARAVAGSQRAPRGPVQLNVPFREPLAPTPQSFDAASLSPLAREGRSGAPLTKLASPSRAPDPLALARVLERIRQHERGVIVCGPRDAREGFAEAVATLSRATGYPVLAEAASQARFGFPEHLAHVDALLRHPGFAAAQRPELVLRFGGGLTPKVPQQWLDASGAEIVVFSDDGALVDPAHRAVEIVEGDAVLAAERLGAAPIRERGAWFRAFHAAELRVRRALDAAFGPDAPLNEPEVARQVVAALAPDSILFVSSSMPIRDVDAFSSPERGRLQVLANRGANGIDGILSTALGASAVSGRSCTLLIGDLALLHDLHGLLIARRHQLSLTVVIVNNDGGGIFSFLPIAQATDRFEALFGTPHGLDLAPLAAFAGARLQRPGHAAALAEALRIAEREGGLQLIEVRTQRNENVDVHRALFERLVAAVEDA